MTAQRQIMTADRAHAGNADAGDRKGWAATGLAALGALAMTSCCILPLALVSLGVGGVFIAQLGSLYAYKWVTFALSAAALGYGFRRAYAPPPPADAACPGGTCARPIDRRAMRALLWGAAAVVLAALAFPALAPLLLPY